MAYEDNTIDLFMWGYQRHFQTSAQRAAKNLFHKIDPDLEAKTFLLGLVRTPGEDKHPVCLEPEDCGWRPDAFASVRKYSEHFLAVDGQENVVAGTESHMKSIQIRRRRRADALAVSKVLNRLPGKSSYFFSGFTVLGEYDVGVVLALSHREQISHYRLPNVYADDELEVPASLIEAAADIFLRKCLRALYQPEPEKVSSLDECDPDEIIRHAGNRLMEAPVFAMNEIEGLYGLFDACNYIASLNYEGAGSVGGMLIVRNDHPNVRPTLRLANPLSLRDYRAIRKLLEVSTSGASLLSDGSHVTGFGLIIGTYNQVNADLFHVRFIGHHKWELLHGEQGLMRVHYGLPRLPMPAIPESRFLSTFEIVFAGIDSERGRRFYELSLEASRQRHGTLLVVTPAAATETERLAKQVTAVVPVTMTPELLQSVTTIDGAVILDFEGKCHAIGAILDGMATPNGDPGRGARFNSCLRYVDSLQSRQIPCLAVVVSEDGTSELVPDLPRRVLRSELHDKEVAVDQLLASSEWSLDRSFPLLNWLDEHRFYLSDNLCSKANEVLRRHDAAIDECGRIKVVRAKFRPDPRMSDAYLF